MRCVRLWIVVALPVAMAAVSLAEPQPSVLGKDGSTMVLVPAGDFIMGSGDDRPDASPPHRRALPAFYIDQTEVMTEQYARFLNETGTQAPPDWTKSADGKWVVPARRARLPITNITWYDAMRYAAWAGKRLPTEAEWEKAARGTDGRVYPWGNVEKPDRRRMPAEETSSTFHKVGPVGEIPGGASPFGCLDMCGNAWEWTADWYEKYPGSDAANPHFGRQYKVIRGGSGLGFYGQPNTGKCASRNRLVPYGAYDSVGFRCVQDIPPAKPPYDATALLSEAENELSSSLREPVQLSYEKQFDAYRAGGRVPITIAGRAGHSGHVRAGFPLPRGLVKDVGTIGLTRRDGTPVSAQTSVLSKWDDDSVRWALLQFSAAEGDSLDVHTAGGPPASPSGPRLTAEKAGPGLVIDTGSMRAVLTPDGLLESVAGEKKGASLGRFTCTMRVEINGQAQSWHTLRADRIDVEENGPIHGVVRLQGFMGGEDGRPSPFRYDLRIHANAGSSRLNLLLTLMHFATRAEPLETPLPVVRVLDVRAGFELPVKPAEFVFGTDRGCLAASGSAATELLQPDDLRYQIGEPGQRIASRPAAEVNVKSEYPGEKAAAPKAKPKAAAPDDRKGTRSPGWLFARTDKESGVVFGVRHFWQNCPKALVTEPGAIAVRLWAGDAPFEWEAGLAKTHELVVELTTTNVATSPPVLDPLRAIVPPAWACGTGAAASIMPRTTESLQTFPYWECWRETSMMEWANAMPAGFRDYGDGYMGGPYKGKNAFQDLEYDIPLNFEFAFLSTGQLWYLNAAEVMARHQADVDIDNFTGRQWKHSPQHTTTEAEFGHVFVRGLLLNYLLTGERRSLEMGMRVGDWLAPRAARGEGVGNERQIGWSLYALTGLYDVTREPRYLQAAESLCRRLVDGQDATGKFAIRWDNRISFFNGIAMNGMITVQEITQDPKLAEGILRCARRTLGFYPEYGSRTLNAFCWALERTRDPRYLDALQRTWNSTIEFLCNYPVEAEDTHAWRFPRFAARYRLFPKFADEATALPDAATWHALRLKNPEATAFVRPASEAPASVVVVREGHTEGRVDLFDGRGHLVKSVELNEAGQYFQATVLRLAPGDTYRIHAVSRNASGWQVQHDGAARLVVHDTSGIQMPFVLPRVACQVRDGAAEVRIKLEATGEGFHAATLYDPSGRPVSTVRHFIDFQDPGRYEIQMNAPVSGPNAGWSLELIKVKVLSVEGLLPYYADRADDWFCPER